MVSGAFARLLSCLTALLHALGVEPLPAVRIVLALCGALFFAGSVYLAPVLETPRGVRIAAAAVGLASVAWSIDAVRPTNCTWPRPTRRSLVVSARRSAAALRGGTGLSQREAEPKLSDHRGPSES